MTPALADHADTHYDVRSSALLLEPGAARIALLAAQVRARAQMPDALNLPPGAHRHAIMHTRAPPGLDSAYAALAGNLEGHRIAADAPGGVVMRLHALAAEPAPFASCAQVVSLDGQLRLSVQMDRALFDGATAELLLRTWQQCALDLCQESSTSQPAIVRAPPVLPVLAELLRAASSRHAQQVALDDGQQRYSYAELIAYAHSSEFLRQARSGHLVLTDEPTVEQARLFYAALLNGIPVLCAPAGSARGSPAETAVIFETSGTTADKATVWLPATALASYATQMVRALCLAPGDRVLRFASMRFDAAVEELLVSFMSGATVVCPVDAAGGLVVCTRKLSFPQFSDLLHAQRISALNVATAWFRAAMRDGLRLPARVRQVVIGGEACDGATWSAFRARYPAVDLVNTYGLTEACVTQTLFRGELPQGASSVPLGWPLAHVDALLVEAGADRVTGALEPGELCLGGASLATGTRANGFQDLHGAPMLRTGDLVRRDAHGCPHYLGRLDQQRKYLGQRVNLHTLSQAAIQAQGDCAHARLDGSQQDGLQLVIAHARVATPALKALARAHSARLHEVTPWPRNISEKTDVAALRRALVPSHFEQDPPATRGVEPIRALGLALIELTGRRWPEHLRIVDIMDSLTWLRLRSRLEQQCELTLGAHEFDLTLAQVESRLAGAGRAAAPVVEAKLHAGFVHQAQRAPRAVALIAGELCHDYASLLCAVQGLQRQLEHAGVGSGDRVAFRAERAVFDVLAMLAISAVGAAFVPLTSAPGTPEACARMAQAGVRFYLHGDGVLTIADSAAGRSEVIADLAYVLFTSGSGGAPKAVAMTHAAAMNTLRAVAGRLQLCAEDRLLALSPSQFDLSIFDVFATLGAGAALIWPDETVRSQPARWPALLERHRISIWNSVPSSMALLLALPLPTGAALHLREVMLSGDFVPRALLLRAAAALGPARISVLGGATEAGIWSCAIDAADSDSAHAPYGPALPGQQLWIDAPDGEIGEILIGGASLAVGYLQDGAVLAPFGPFYRTGDLGRARRGGSIEILGRADQCVKWRGARVSVAATEARLLDDASVEAACVQCVDDTVVAVLQLVAGSRVEQVRARWRARSDEELSPEQWLEIESMPLTANGKLDRLALRQLAQAHVRTAAPPALDAGDSHAAARALALWQQFLPHIRSPEQGDWIAQGGHSLMALRLVEAALAQGAHGATLGGFLEQPTLATLTRWFTPPARSDSGRRQQEARPCVESPVRISPALRARLRATRDAILVTGATGMLASALIDQLQQGSQRMLILGVRADDEDAAASRLPALPADRQMVLPMQLSQVRFGLDAECFNALGDALGDIWHLAADVNFLQPASELEATNVRALREVHALACVRGARLHFASTLGVFPYQLQADVDECSARPAGLFASGYAESKWRAETLLRELSHAPDSGLPAAPIHVYRLGLLAGATLRPFDMLGMAFSALQAIRSWPRLTGELNLLDHRDAASAMLLLATEPAATWHLQNLVAMPLANLPDQVAPQWPVLSSSDWIAQLRALEFAAGQRDTRLARDMVLLLLPGLVDVGSRGRILSEHTHEVLRERRWQPRTVLQVLRGLVRTAFSEPG